MTAEDTLLLMHARSRLDQLTSDIQMIQTELSNEGFGDASGELAAADVAVDGAKLQLDEWEAARE